MKQLDYKKLLRDGKDWFSPERVMAFSIFAIIIISLAVVAADLFIFLGNYRVVSDVPIVPEGRKIEVSKQNLEQALKEINKQ